MTRVLSALSGSRDPGIARFSRCSELTPKDGGTRTGAAGGAAGLVLLLLVSTPAEGRWRVDVEGGAIVPTSTVTVGEAGQRNFDVDTDVSTDFNVGGSFAAGGGYSLNDYVEVGGQFQSNFSGLDIGVASDTLRVYSLTAGPRVYLLPATYRFRPWAVGQIGWYRASAESSFFGATVDHTEDAFGANVGGGFDVAIVPLVSMGIDVRYHRPVDVFDGFAFVTTMLNVGFHFGQPD